MLHRIIGQFLDYCRFALLNSAPRITYGAFNRACRVFRTFPPGFNHPDKRIRSLSEFSQNPVHLKNHIPASDRFCLAWLIRT